MQFGDDPQGGADETVTFAQLKTSPLPAFLFSLIELRNEPKTVCAACATAGCGLTR